MDGTDGPFTVICCKLVVKVPTPWLCGGWLYPEFGVDEFRGVERPAAPLGGVRTFDAFTPVVNVFFAAPPSAPGPLSTPEAVTAGDAVRDE